MFCLCSRCCTSLYQFKQPLLIQVLILQAKGLTRSVVQTLDNVASIMLNQMIPGRKTTVLVADGNVLVLAKDYGEAIFNQTFRFSPLPGYDSGVKVTIKNTAETGEVASTDTVLGLGVSRHFRYL